MIWDEKHFISFFNILGSINSSKVLSDFLQAKFTISGTLIGYPLEEIDEFRFKVSKGLSAVNQQKDDEGYSLCNKFHYIKF
jgi:hypothetical protein